MTYELYMLMRQVVAIEHTYFTYDVFYACPHVRQKHIRWFNMDLMSDSVTFMGR